MWLDVGSGTLWGATAGAIIMFLVTLKVAWRAHSLKHRSFKINRPDVNFAFEHEATVAFFRETPVRAVLTIYGIPILICAVVGFVIENVTPIF